VSGLILAESDKIYYVNYRIPTLPLHSYRSIPRLTSEQEGSPVEVTNPPSSPSPVEDHSRDCFRTYTMRDWTESRDMEIIFTRARARSDQGDPGHHPIDPRARACVQDDRLSLPRA